MESAATHGDSPALRWLLQQRQIVIRDAGLTWRDEMRAAPPLVLDHVNLRIEKRFGTHEFGLVGTPPAEIASTIDVRGELTAPSIAAWKAATGPPYLRVDFVDLAPWTLW